VQAQRNIAASCENALKYCANCFRVVANVGEAIDGSDGRQSSIDYLVAGSDQESSNIVPAFRRVPL